MQQVSPRLPACSIEVWPVFQEDLPRESTQLLGALFAARLRCVCVCVFVLRFEAVVRNPKP